MEETRFELQMTCENDDFQGGGRPDFTVARILHEIADRVMNNPSDHGYWQTIHDADGNDVGRYRLHGGHMDRRLHPDG